MSRGLGAELWRAQQAHRGALYAALADVGLTPPQYAALTLARSTPGISSAELARQAYVSAQTMQAIVASLERRGLLERHAQPAGRVLAAWPDRGRARAAGGGPAPRARRRAAHDR